MAKFPSIFKAFSRSKLEKQHPIDQDMELKAEVAKNRGNEFYASGNYLSAIQCYQESLNINPSYAEAQINLGSVFRELGRLQEAEQMLKSAVVLNPLLWQGHYQFGLLLNQLGRFENAVDSYHKSIELNPGFNQCHWQLGLSLAKMGKWREAIKEFGSAKLPEDEFQELHANYGFALMHTQNFEESLHHLQTAIKLGETADLHLVAGSVYNELSMLPEAELSFRNVRRLDPDNPEINVHLAHCALLQGDYLNGFKHFEKRLNLRVRVDWAAPIRSAIDKFGIDRYWKGQDIAGRDILILGEGGLGDSLMMLRYIPLLKSLNGAGKLSVECDPSLRRIYESVSEIDEVILRRTDIPISTFDWYCFDMSLPYLFQTELKNIPSPYYLMPTNQQRDKWTERISRIPGLKVGITWSGNVRYEADSIRSVILDKLVPLFSIPGIAWISLQKGNAAKQLSDCEHVMHDWMDECNDLADTASLIDHLDLVITVDTAIVHLAGTIGRPTWLLNRYATDWRWLLENEDSPWYPSIRIFRQARLNDWDGVIEKVAEQLRSY